MATKVLSDYVTEVTRLLAEGASIIQSDDYATLISQAIEVYSEKVSLETVVDLTSDGSGDFKLSDLTGYDSEISGDPLIEYPISTSSPPNTLDRREWMYYSKPAASGGRVMRLASPPNSGDHVRFTFKSKHSITSGGSTIVDSHFYAFCKLGAAEGCDQLARYYTQTGEGNEGVIGGQSFFISKAKEYETRATNLRKKAYEVIGVGAGTDQGPGAASVTKNLDMPTSYGGARVTHPRWRR
jgi:hypothetical protein